MKNKCYIGNTAFLTLKYNVFENNTNKKIIGEFSSGEKLYNPYLIALSLINIDINILKFNEQTLNEKKVCQYFKNDIPFESILYTLTGGQEIWQSKFEWNFEKAYNFWKDDLTELLENCLTIYDLILVFLYFKWLFVPKRFGEFINRLKE